MFAILIIGLIAGPAVSLYGITDRVARDARGMGLGALAAVGAVLDQLLRVVPRAAARGHRDREEETGHDRADQEPAEHLGLDDPDDDRDRDRDERRQQHAPDRRAGDDRDRGRVVRPRGALHDARVLAELAPHLLDDLAADAADGRHRQRGEEERHHPADEEAGDHPGILEREADVEPLVREAADVLVEEDQRGETGRADRVALRDGLGRVADRVERVGDAAHRLGHVGHLGDPARVVGDGAVGVERDDQAGHRELRHHGDADPVDRLVGRVVRADDAGRDRRSPGSAVACIPYASPAMMFVAWPVWDASAIFFTGLQREPV